jgi:uncharacterized iron-regulated membrane protein
MRALWPAVLRGLIWFHRWAGVALCLLFVMWFASGAVLHFVPFPALSEAERLRHSEPIDFSKLNVGPSAALARNPGSTALRLVSVLGRPVYLASGSDGLPVAVAGDSGKLLPPITAKEAQALAQGFSGHPVAQVTGPLITDQWVVHQAFDASRPYYRVSLADKSATELYVSMRTGEIVQQTRRWERGWNWCGAVVHWIYLTPLRANWAAWNQTVWWVSLVALLATVAGIWLGLQRYLALRASGRAGLSPYRGWMKWHHVLGLFGGLVVLAWIFSGWLSMDHGRLFSKDGATPEYAARLQGMPIAVAADAVSTDVLRQVTRATSVGFHAIAGKPFLAVAGREATDSRDVWLPGPGTTATQAIPEGLMDGAVRAGWPTAIRLGTAGDSVDSLYRLAESIPPSALAYIVPGATAQRIYVDPLTGQLLAVMDPSRRSYAWVYYALHTFNYPALIALPATRTSVVLALLVAGTGLSLTSFVIALRRVRRELRAS